MTMTTTQIILQQNTDSHDDDGATVIGPERYDVYTLVAEQFTRFEDLEFVETVGDLPAGARRIHEDQPHGPDYWATYELAVRTLVADDKIPEGADDPTGRPATPEQIEASDNAPEGLIYIDGRDGTVCPGGSFAHQQAQSASALLKVWVD